VNTSNKFYFGIQTLFEGWELRES